MRNQFSPTDVTDSQGQLSKELIPPAKPGGRRALLPDLRFTAVLLAGRFGRDRNQARHPGQPAERARAGEDFSNLVAELSDDPESKPKNGELTFAKGQGIVPPQFESAAFSLEPGKISDPVLTVFGYHVIKLLEKLPPAMVPLEKVEDRIRRGLQRDAVQKKLPDFIAELKKEAAVEMLLK